MVDVGYWGHILHNLILVIVYISLGTVYLPGFVRRLDIPQNVRKLFKVSILVFFLACAFTHLELMLHTSELPSDYYTLYHNVFGFAQAAGAAVLVYVLHPLIFPRK